MEKLFEVYVISIGIIILGMFMNRINGGADYLRIIILLLFLFLTSMDLKCIIRREFLFVQLILIIVLAVDKIVNKAIVIMYLYKNNFAAISYPINSSLYWICVLLQIVGYASVIICLVKYNKVEKNN